jgi:hypothetical protein
MMKNYKKPVPSFLRYFFILFLFLTTTLIYSCGDNSSSTPSDPAGTITVSINYTAGTQVQFYSGTDACPYTVCSTYEGDQCTQYSRYSNVNIYLTMSSDVNFHSHSCVTNIDDCYSNYGHFSDKAIEYTDMGSVNGLGDLKGKKIPESGWTPMAYVAEGHGYFARYKHSYSTSCTAEDYTYAGIYVVRYQTSSGKIIGAVIKMKNPW